MNKHEQELLDRLLSDYEKPEDILGEGGLLKRLTKAVVDRALSTEMSYCPIRLNVTTKSGSR